MHVTLYKNKNKNYPSWYNLDITYNLQLKSYYRKKSRSINNYYYVQFSRMRALVKWQIKIVYNHYLGKVGNQYFKE